MTKKPAEGKTIDFEGRIGNMQVVVAAKRTVGAGGSQDNQRLDLLSFGDEAPAIGSEPLVILLADGSHYPDGFHKEQTDRFRAAGKNVIVTDTAGLDKAIASVVSPLPPHGHLTDLPANFIKAQSDREEEIRTELRTWHDSMLRKVQGKAKGGNEWKQLLAGIKCGAGKSKQLQKEDKNRYARILSCAENLDVAPTELLAQMLGFGDFSSTFATLAMRKQASRTRWQEDYQFSVLHRGSTTISLPEKPLPHDGPSSRYLVNGEVTDKRPARSKSLDFRGTLVSDPSQDVVIAAKYAEIGGGGQDNQYADLRKFGHNAPILGSDDPLVILLADGDYYTETTRKRPKSRISEMRDMFAGKNVVVTDSAHLDQEVKAWEKRVADLATSAS